MVFQIIVLESASIAALGAALGLLLYLALMSGVAALIRSQTGVVLDPFQAAPVLLWVPASMVLLGAVAGVVPAVKAYRTDIASNLAPSS